MGNDLVPAGERAEAWRLRAQLAIFRLAARHDDLLRRDAFEELATVLSEYVSLGRLVVVVPEGGEQVLYAASIGDAASPLPPFGARFPLPEAENRRIVMEGGYRICRDTRSGDALDRLVAQTGYLSYAALPIRDLSSAADPPPIVAKLIVCFGEVEQSAQAPLELLEAVASLFGSRFQRALVAARERRLAMILETSGDAMLAWNAAGQIADANAAASRLTGLERAKLLGHRAEDLIENFASDERRRTFRTRLRTQSADGVAAWLPVALTITRVEDDPVVAAHLLARDISHVVNAEREAAEHTARVRVLEQEHRALLDNAPLVIFRLDPGTADLRYLNRYAEVLLGITPEHAREHPGCLRAAHADAAAADGFEQALKRARLGLPLEPYEARLLKPDGSEISIRCSIYALAQHQEVVAIEGILVDVSAEQAARTQLVQTDRLSTLGRLAASVAHEINNPAAFLMLGLEHLTRLALTPSAGSVEEERAAALKLLGQMTDSLERIATIVRDLRLFAGPVQARAGAAAVPTDVLRAVQCALTLTRSQLVERARLLIELAPVPAALIEQGRLAQVVVNLLVNAAQAIPKGSAREHRITISTRARQGEIELEVSDTGVGIAKADLARIWTPFFTTKPFGTGLGLSISRDIVARAGGRIDLISPASDEPGVGPIGSRFIVRLKQAASTAAVSHAARPERGAARAREVLSPSQPRKRILIVEDESALGGALKQVLELAHEVRLAATGACALELLDAESFDVILCDVRMPGISGETLYAQACARYPRCQSAFIFMTGLGCGTDLARLQALYGRPILEKPFPMERLLRTIEELE